MDPQNLYRHLVRACYELDLSKVLPLAIFLIHLRQGLQLLQSRTVWAIAAMTFCYIMISGFMYVQLEERPFFKVQENGVIEWFHTYFEEQWAVEVYLVSAINATIALGMILIIETAGGVDENSCGARAAPRNRGMRRLIQSVVGLLLVCAFFAIMVSVYAIKNWGYPYSYPLTDIWPQE